MYSFDAKHVGRANGAAIQRRTKRTTKVASILQTLLLHVLSLAPAVYAISYASDAISIRAVVRPVY